MSKIPITQEKYIEYGHLTCLLCIPTVAVDLSSLYAPSVSSNRRFKKPT